MGEIIQLLTPVVPLFEDVTMPHHANTLLRFVRQRDAKLLEIGGGTNESHHKNMTRDLSKAGNKLEQTRLLYKY